MEIDPAQRENVKPVRGQNDWDLTVLNRNGAAGEHVRYFFQSVFFGFVREPDRSLVEVQETHGAQTVFFVRDCENAVGSRDAHVVVIRVLHFGQRLPDREDLGVSLNISNFLPLVQKRDPVHHGGQRHDCAGGPDAVPELGAEGVVAFRVAHTKQIFQPPEAALVEPAAQVFYVLGGGQ